MPGLPRAPRCLAVLLIVAGGPTDSSAFFVSSPGINIPQRRGAGSCFKRKVASHDASPKNKAVNGDGEQIDGDAQEALELKKVKDNVESSSPDNEKGGIKVDMELLAEKAVVDDIGPKQQDLCDVIQGIDQSELKDTSDAVPRESENDGQSGTARDEKSMDLQKMVKDTLFPSFFSNKMMKSKILNERSYARASPFTRKELKNPPALDDLLPEPTKPSDSFYLSPLSIILSFLGSTGIFPFVIMFLDTFTVMEPSQLDSITSKFLPGVSIVYGTFISLTLSISYNRQRIIQESVAKETSHLAFLLQSTINLFSDNRDKTIEASQTLADQMRILARESRGVEYMGIIYTDPYSRLLSLIQDEEKRLFNEDGGYGSMANTLSACRDTIRDIRTSRASRLSDEALALPPTHFTLLKGLTFLLLLAYATSVLPAVNQVGYATKESCLLFGVLFTIYDIFYSVANDLNDPYNGIFVLRRGSSAAHLLQMKNIIANHDWLKDEIKFECAVQEVKCRTPGLDKYYFENEQGYNK